MLGIFLDTETNGLNPQKHRIIEIALQIIDLCSGQLQEEFHTVVSQSEKVWKVSDLESLQVNGFTWNEVIKGKSEKITGNMIIELFNKYKIQRGSAVFICQNPSFDRVFFTQLIDIEIQETLNWPYHWLDLASMYWTKSLIESKKGEKPFPWETGFSKDLIASTLNIPNEKKPHRAMNGVKHLIACYRKIVGFPYALVEKVE